MDESIYITQNIWYDKDMKADKKKHSGETELIIAALQDPKIAAKKETKPKRSIVNLFELKDSDPVVNNAPKDAIKAIVDKKVKAEKAKAARAKRKLNQWTNSDFFHYFNDLLLIHSARCEMTSRAKDLNDMGRAYDKLVDKIGDKCNNFIFKQYLEWWASAYGDKFANSPLRVAALTDDKYIDRFTNRFEDIVVAVPPSDKPKVSYDDQTLFEMGGLQLLLTSKGIVRAYSLLKRLGNPNPIDQIELQLKKFDKILLSSTINITMSYAPYKKSEIIDFIAIARSSLDPLQITEFNNVNYKSFFGDKSVVSDCD